MKARQQDRGGSVFFLWKAGSVVNFSMCPALRVRSHRSAQSSIHALAKWQLRGEPGCCHASVTPHSTAPSTDAVSLPTLRARHLSGEKVAQASPGPRGGPCKPMQLADQPPQPPACPPDRLYVTSKMTSATLSPQPGCPGHSGTLPPPSKNPRANVTVVEGMTVQPCIAEHRLRSSRGTTGRTRPARLPLRTLAEPPARQRRAFLAPGRPKELPLRQAVSSLP